MSLPPLVILMLCLLSANVAIAEDEPRRPMRGHIAIFEKPPRFEKVELPFAVLPLGPARLLSWSLGETLTQVHSARVHIDGAEVLLRQVDSWKDPQSKIPLRKNRVQWAPTIGKAAGYFRVWAYFPPLFEWSDALVGDLNGDGYDDVLMRGSGLGSWWVALSNGETGLEMPVSGLEDVSGEIGSLLLADLNDDGADDLLAWSSQTGTLSYYSLQSKREVPTFCIRIDGGDCIENDSDGYFSFLTSGAAARQKITVERAGWTSSPRIREFDASSSQIIGFVAVDNRAVDNRGADGVVGRALQLGESGPGPYVCLGYNSKQYDKKWSAIGDGVCPDNYAFFGVSSPERRGALESMRSEGDCCRLPEDDMLVGEPRYEPVACPDGYIATGFRSEGHCENCAFWIQCRQVNATRYQLGPITPGKTVGISRGKKRWSNRVDRDAVPVAIRDAIGRRDYDQWDSHACTGLPWGSLFVRKGKDACEKLGFRELQYRGRPGDPPQGTPVSMFPDCTALENPYDPTSGCYARSTRLTGSR